MAISKIRFLSFVLASAAASASAAAASHEAASPSACESAATQPAITNAKAALARNPSDLPTRFGLADAWSDAGCFNDALQVLQGAGTAHQGNKELQTRLRVAKSLIGEEHFFDALDRANLEAKLKRDTFRCTTLADLDACSDAVRMRPDDPALLIADGDALSRAQRPADAIGHYRRAAALVQDKTEIDMKINAAEAQLSSSQADAALASDAARQQRQPAGPVQGNTGAALQIARTSREATLRYSNAERESSSH
jgi:tetratricopeptide (TPR) repeat protein